LGARNPWALVPIKEARLAKSRLKTLFDGEQRQAIFFAMIVDVLAALRASGLLRGFAAVTADAVAAEMTRRSGGRVLEPRDGGDHNAAVREASRELAAREGADAVLVVPMDVPLLMARDVDHILSMHRESRAALTLVPSADLRGTNAMLMSPPGCIAPCFGDNSFIAHCNAARRAGILHAVLSLPNVALDIDWPEDIELLLRVPRRTETHSALARAGFQVPTAGASPAQAFA